MIRIPSNCTGCSACISVCPKKCISPSTDAEGFMTPLIDPTECIDRATASESTKIIKI